MMENQNLQEDFAVQFDLAGITEEADGEYGEEYRDYLGCDSLPAEKPHRHAVYLALSVLCLILYFALVILSWRSIHQNNAFAEKINSLPFTLISTDGPPKPPVAPEAVFAQTIQLKMPDTALPDAIAQRVKAEEQDAAASQKKSVQYEVRTEAASHSLIAAQLGKSFGTLYCNKWGMQVSLVYSNAQSVLDAAGTACVLTPDIKNLPGIGEPSGAAVILDYNFQAFSALGQAKAGDRLYADTTYGEFVYEVTKTQLGMVSQDGASIILDDNTDLMEYCTSGKFTGVALCTGYPLDMDIDTGYRYVVFAKLVDGTSMTL